MLSENKSDKASSSGCTKRVFDSFAHGRILRSASGASLRLAEAELKSGRTRAVRVREARRALHPAAVASDSPSSSSSSSWPEQKEGKE